MKGKHMKQYERLPYGPTALMGQVNDINGRLGALPSPERWNGEAGPIPLDLGNVAPAYIVTAQRAGEPDLVRGMPYFRDDELTRWAEEAGLWTPSRRIGKLLISGDPELGRLLAVPHDALKDPVQPGYPVHTDQLIVVSALLGLYRHEWGSQAVAARAAGIRKRFGM